MSSSSDPIRTDRGLQWMVNLTPAPSILPPIMATITSGGLYLHDWLTVSEARQLGARLMTLALEIESRDAEIEHFDQLDGEESDAERQMRTLCDASLTQAKAAGALIDAILAPAETPDAQNASVERAA